MFYVILPNIRSLYNIGSIFRTADAIGVDKIFLTGYSGRPDKQPKIAKTALGAENFIKWEYKFHTWQVIEDLKKQGFDIVALELTKQSVDFRKFKSKNKKIALIVGNEVKGLSKQILRRCDQTIHLPMVGKKESLNVGVAFGVLGYFIQFQIK
jgi:23S rRNA (guanosine2251-2'-O)-methyltransferase